MAIHDLLRARQIDFVFLKGPFQQQLLYDDHFMKPSGDVDVLVSPAGFFPARDALRSIGYEVAGKSRSVWWVRFLGEQHMTRGDGPRPSTVDLHYRLQQPGSPSPRDADGFLRRKRQLEIAGATVPFTSAADTLLLSCISVAKALFNREPCAGYVCDVRASASRLDEADQQLVLDAAVKQGLDDTLLLGLRVADVLLGGAGTLLSERATHDPVTHRQRGPAQHGHRAVAVVPAMAAAANGVVGIVRPCAGPLSGRGRLGGVGRHQPPHL